MIQKNKQARILTALQKYYTEDITFERIADEARISIYELIEFVNDFDFPIIQTEKDVIDGLKRIGFLTKKFGLKMSFAG